VAAVRPRPRSRSEFGGYAWITLLVGLALPLTSWCLRRCSCSSDATLAELLAFATFAVFTGVLVRRT